MTGSDKSEDNIKRLIKVHTCSYFIRSSSPFLELPPKNERKVVAHGKIRWYKVFDTSSKKIAEVDT